MRPQLGPIANNAPSNLEDLGWNDMGDNDDTPHEAEIVRLAPSPATRHAERQAWSIDRGPAATLTGSSAAALTPSRGERQGRRVAFTLRLDPERHLKLRLASTIRNVSAQYLVTEALDRLLGEMSDLEALAAHVTGPHGNPRGKR